MFVLTGRKKVYFNVKPQKHIKSSKTGRDPYLKVVCSEKVAGSGVASTIGTLYGGVVMGVLVHLMRLTSCIEMSTVHRHKSKI